MPTSPNFALPYQDLNDPPDGPNLGEDLALAVDAALTTLDSDLTTAAATLAALGISAPRGYMGSTSRTSAVTTTTAETLADSITWTAVAGRRYKLTYSGSYFSTVALDALEFRVRIAAGASVTTGGTQVRGHLLTCFTANGVAPLHSTVPLSGIAAGQTTIGIFVLRNAGSGSVSLQGAANQQAITILEDIGV